MKVGDKVKVVTGMFNSVIGKEGEVVGVALPCGEAFPICGEHGREHPMGYVRIEGEMASSTSTFFTEDSPYYGAWPLTDDDVETLAEAVVA